MSAKIMTAFGNAQISTAQSKFGGASMLLDGTGDYISTPAGTDFNFGAGNFTIDFWFRPATINLDRHSLYCQYNDVSNYIQASLVSNVLYLFISGGGGVTLSINTIGVITTANIWYHIAFVRCGSALTIFVNGLSKATTSIGTGLMPTLTGDVTIGARKYSGVENRYATGCFDEFRVSKGIARWTTDFTPPTTKYDTDEYTVLLLHMDGTNGNTTFTDNSVQSMVFKSSGTAIYSSIAFQSITNCTMATISWDEETPTGTSVAVSTVLSATVPIDAEYVTCNEGEIASLVGVDMSNKTLYIKVALSTTDTAVTPSFSNLQITVTSSNDAKSIILEMKPLERFESAVGDITVAYDGVGGLSGTGGQVAPFSVSFTPSELAYKGDQNEQEHLEISNISTVGTLTLIYYISTVPQEEHIEISSIATVGTLIHVNDL